MSIRNAPNMRARLRYLATSALVGAGSLVGAMAPASAQTYSDFGTVNTTAISGEGGAASPTFALSNSDARLDVSLAANATIINWQDFKVTSGKIANFTNIVAATPPVSVLNRVTTNVTTIDGMLTADPSVSVFVFNPNGVTITPSGSFSGGSLVLSTAGIGDADFLDGSGYTLTGASAAGSIQNMGAITAAGGFAAVAQNVRNSGTITSASGEVALIAAKTVTLGFAAGSPITIDVGAGTEIGTAKVDANGTISAQSIKVAGVASSGMVGTLLGVDSGASLTATADGGRVFIGNDTDTNGVAGSFTNSAATTLDTGLSVAGAVNAPGQNASIGIRNKGNITVAGNLTATNATLNNGGFIDMLGIGMTNMLTTTGALTATGSVGKNAIAIEANGNVSVAQLTATNGDANVTSNTASATLGTATTGALLDVAGSTAVSVTGNVTAGFDYLVRGKSVTLGTTGTTVAQTSAGKIDIIAADGAITGNSGLTLTSNSGGAADGGNSNYIALDATNGGIAFDPATTIIAGTAAGRESLLGIRTAGTNRSVALGAVTARSIVDAGASPGRTFAASFAGATSFLSGNINVAGALDIQISGPITTGAIDVSGGSLTLAANGAGNLITLNGDVSTSAGQSYLTAVTLGANVIMSSASAGDIVFSNTLDGTRGLTINTAGATRFGGAVGGTDALITLLTDSGGSTAINGGSVRTTSTQTFNDAVTLGADTTLTSIGGRAITLASTVNGAQSLTVNTVAATTFGGAVGGTTALTSLTTNAGGTTAINGGSVSTTGGQSYGDGVTLGANTVLASSAAGAISFGSTLNGARTLAINTAGATSFGGAVGGTTALVSITTDAAGTMAFNGGTITTSGAQSYNDAATLGAATTLNSTGAGAITLASTVDGARTLSVNTTGTTTFGGAVGAGAALTSLNTNTGGTTILNGGSVTTTGAQGYGDAVTLGASTVLTSTGNGAINLGSTVDSTNETQSLRITTGGTTTFGGLVGFITSRALESLVVDGGGTLLVNGGGVTTVNGQTYSDDVRLNSNALFGAQGNVSFLGKIDGPLLAIIASNGAVTLGGAIGSTTPLSRIAVTGNGGGIAINGGTVRTTGDQLYNNAVTLGANTTATSTAAGNINFVSTVNGAVSLGVNTSGLTTFGGAVGGTTALTSLATNVGGSTAINGGRVTTTGAQSYGDPVTLGANTILSGSTAIFNGLLTGGGFNLTGNFTGLIDINAAFAGLGDLSLSGGGIDFGGQTLTAAGTVSLDANTGALTGGSAAAGTTMTASGASVDVVGLSGQSVNANAVTGNLKLVNASATTGSVDLSAANGSATLVGNIDAALDLRATAQSITLGGTGAATQSAKRDVVLTATAGGVSTAAGAGTYTLISNSDLNDYAGPAQGGETRITATGGNITLGNGSILKSASAGGLSAGITLNAGTGSVSFGTLTGDIGSPARADALSITAGTITAGGDISVFRDLTLSATGAIALNNATVTRAGANIGITSNTSLTAGTLTSAGGVSAVAGTYAVGAANANGGDVNLTALTGAGVLGGATASGNVLIDVRNALATVTGSVDAGGSYNVSGLGIMLGGATFAEQKAKANISLNSNGGNVTTGAGVFFLTSNGDQSSGGTTTIQTGGGDAIFGANTKLTSFGGAAADSGVIFDVGTGNLTFGPLVADALISNPTASSITSFGNAQVRNAVSLTSTGAIDLASVETTGPAATITVDGTTVKAARLAGAGGVIVSGDSLDLTDVSSAQNYVTLAADVGDLKVATINAGTGVNLAKTGASGELIVTGGANSGQVGVGHITINSSTAARLGAGNFASAITATQGSVSIIATGDVTGTETAPGSGVFNRAVVSALAADGDVTIDSPGQGLALLGPLLAGRNLTVTAGPVDIAPGAVATNGALSLTAFNGDITVGTVSGGASALVRAANGNATVSGSISSANGSVSVLADAGIANSAGGSAKGDLVLRGNQVVLSGSQGADGKVDIQGAAGGISGSAGLTILSNRDGVGAEAIILDAGGGDISLAGSTLIGGTPADLSAVGLFLRTPQNVTLGNVDALTIASVAGDHATFFAGVLGSNNVIDVTLGNVTTQNTLDITADGGITAGRVQVTGANQNLLLNARGVGKDLTLTDAASATGSVMLSGQTNVTGTTVTGRAVSVNSNDGGITLTSVDATGGAASLRAGFGPVRVDRVTTAGGGISIDSFSDVSGRTPGTRSTLIATGAASDIVVAANGQVLLNAPMAERDLRVRAGAIDITPTAVAANGALSLIASGDIVVQSASGGASALVESLTGNATVTTGISSANGSASVLAALTANSANGSARTDLIVRGGNVILAGTQGADGRVDISSTAGTITGAAGLAIASNRDGAGAEALILDATGGDILLGNATITGGTAADRSLIGLRFGTQQNATFGDINALSVVSVFVDHATFAPAVLGSNNVGNLTFANVTTQNTLDVTADGNIGANTVTVTGSGQNLALNARGPGSNLTLSGAVSAPGNVSLTAQNQVSGTTVTGGSVSAMTTDGPVLLDTVTATNGSAQLISTFNDVRVTGVTATGGGIALTAGGNVSARTPGVRTNLAANGATSDISFNVGGQVLIDSATAGRDVVGTLGNLDALTITTTAGKIDLTSTTGSLLLDKGSAGTTARLVKTGSTGDLRITDNLVAGTAAGSTGDVTLSSATDILVKDYNSAAPTTGFVRSLTGSISATAAGNIKGIGASTVPTDRGFDTIASGGNLNISGSGDIRVDTLSATGALSVSTTNGSLTANGAGTTGTAVQGSALFAQAAGKTVTVTAGAAPGNLIQFNQIRAGGDVTLSADTIAVGTVETATGTLTLSTSPGTPSTASKYYVGLLTSPGNLSLSLAGAAATENLISGTNVLVPAFGATDLTAGTSIAVDVAQAAQIDQVAAPTIAIRGGGVTIADADAVSSLDVLARSGGLYLADGAVTAGTARLEKQGGSAVTPFDELRVTTKLTTSGNSTTISSTNARIAEIESTAGGVSVQTGADLTDLAAAPAAIDDVLRVKSLSTTGTSAALADAGDVRIGTITGNGGVSATAKAGSVTGLFTSDKAAGSGAKLTALTGAVSVNSGGRAAIGTVAGNSIAVNAGRASLDSATATGLLSVTGAQAVSVQTGIAGSAMISTTAGTSAVVPLTSSNFIIDTSAGQATLTSSAGSIAVTAGQVAQIGTATARNAIDVTAAAAAVQTSNAMTGVLNITANTGGLYVETGTSGGDSNLVKRAGSPLAPNDEIRVTQALTTGGAATIDSSTHARLAQVTANGGTLSVKTGGATTGLVGGSPAGVPDGNFGRALLTTGGANNDITVDAGSLMQIAGATATGSIALRTATGDIYADSLSANEDIAAKSGRDTTLVAATAGDDIELQTGRDLFATSLTSQGTGPGVRRASLGGTSISFGAAAADRSNILIDATRDATVTSANANATFAADATSNFTASNGAATAIVAGEDVAIRAGGTLTLAGPTGIAAVTARDDVDLISGGSMTISRVASLGSGTDDRRVAFGPALPGFGAETIARSNVLIDSSANIDVTSADAAASFAALADGNIVAGTIIAGEDAAFGSLGNSSIASVTARDDIEAVADGTVTIRSVTSPGALGSGADDRRVTFSAAGPGFVAESLLRNNLFVDAIGNVTLGTGATAAAPEVDIKASIGVLTSGSLTASNLKAGEDIVIASGDATIGKAEAGDDLVVNSTGGIAFLQSGQTFGTGLDDRTIAATRSSAGLTATGGLAFATESNTGGDIVLDANGVGTSIAAPSLIARNDLIVRNLGSGAAALIDIGSATAQTGMIAMTGTGAGIRLSMGVAETTASLTTTGATADIEVTTKLEAKGNATINSSRDARLALVKSTTGNITATVARDLTGLSAPAAFGAGTGLRVKTLADSGTTSITADTGDIRIGDLTNSGGAVGVTATQGSVTGIAVADVLAGPGAVLDASGSIAAIAGNRAAIKTATAGASIGVTATTISAETATARAGTLSLTANGDALSLDSGSGVGVTLSTKAGTAAGIGLTDANAVRDTFSDAFGSANIAATGAGRSVTVNAAQAAQLGTVSAANAIGVTAAAAAVRNAAATAGSLTLTAQKGGLYLGTGTAGTTAALTKTDTDVDGLSPVQLGRDELRVVTSLTSGQAATINSATDARLKSVTATTGNVGVTTTRDATGLQLSVAAAPAASVLSSATDVLSPDFGGAVITASNAAGNVSVTAGKVAQIDTASAGNGVTVTAAAAAIKAATASAGALAVNATAGGLYVGKASAGTTATLAKTDTDGDGLTSAQAGLDELRVRTSLTSAGNTTINSATSNRLAGGSATNFVKSTGGSISVTSTAATTGLLAATAGASDATYGRGDLVAAAAAQDVTVTSGGLSQLGTVTAGRNVTAAAGNATLRGGLPVNGAIDITSVTAGSGALSLAARAVSPVAGSAEDGDIIIGTGIAGTTATLSNAATGTVGNVIVTQSLRAGGNIDITSVQNARLAGDAVDRAITSTGGTMRVAAAQSVTGVASGATGGTDGGFGRANLSATASGQDVIVTSGALVQAGSVAAGRNVSVDAGNATQGNGAVDIGTASAGSGSLLLRARATSTANAPILDGDILLGTGTAGTTLTLTNVANGGNTGNVTVTTSLSAPGTVLVDAANQAALGTITSTGANVLVQSNQIAINGTVRAAASGEIRLVNRVDTGTTQVNGTSLGSEGTEATQFVLSDAEIDRLQATKVIIETKQTATQTQNVTINGVSLNAGTGSTDFKVLAEKPGDQVADAGPSIFLNGLLSSESNVVRTVQIGGGDATGAGISTTPIANRIIATTTNSGGGRINLPTATVDLRASRIVFGTKSLSDATIGLSPGSIANDFVANANSLLFDSRGGYDTTAQTFLTAGSLTVRYNQFALFQNSATRGLNDGILLGDPTLATDAPVRLRLFSTGDAPAANAFAFFGTINGFIGRSAGLLPGVVVSFAESNGTAIRINQSQSRLNGCVVGAPDKGCLTTEAPVPQLKLFDERQLLLLSAAVETPLSFDPLIGANNESLFVDFGGFAVAPDEGECQPGDGRACPKPEGNQ